MFTETFCPPVHLVSSRVHLCLSAGDDVPQTVAAANLGCNAVFSTGYSTLLPKGAKYLLTVARLRLSMCYHTRVLKSA